MSIDNKFLLKGFDFDDNSGSMFKAKADFYHPETKTVIEFKCHKLNHTVSIGDGLYLKDNKQAYAGNRISPEWLQLQFGWNHSAVKQAIVSNELWSRGFEYVVVFHDDTILSKGKGLRERDYIAEQERYRQLGLEFMYESEMVYLLDPDYTEIYHD
ncbi:hypothetical protein [Shewanella sp. MBTL60-007]|uniref:hypothetical protein n=1 Tax=Shewanella sp. MBTL60-007 TaxID=2815911 RepID=UPI001C802E9A|nr:hypothetical protein [Shewanella sp. MBTL60-007]